MGQPLPWLPANQPGLSYWLPHTPRGPPIAEEYSLGRKRPRGVQSTCLYRLELARAAMLPASSCTCDVSVVGTSSSLHPAKPYSRADLTRLGGRIGLTLINADSPLSSSWSMLGGAEAREPRRGNLGTYQRAPPPGSDPRHSRPHPLSA